ncbi:transcriptional regulator, LacI family protein [Corynebacterium renale]|uniref:LacI family transcriptional regulator n=1 Tax=Corynebacterium renale TaxID=1724 RepID=A0A2A9DQ28_9CORY|nr:LacI family DNA-binding transcriptional regulator [Corynebacterium renale]PFG28020.1 LacI family transcriptional regulator [Corynebacterium renale]SQG65393.1 transcriptional regulator, LacI family protein [Corynebacterium renale]SQI21304.1 transcriptional regulator, LacI family protein [Corynebacterium renale]STC99159.1 transcriptional regulator, LacI family protein [Corynebacterium renale]
MPTPRPQRTTLADLAQALGVSRTTVSNAYNHPDQLSPALRKKILAEAARRGYSGPDPMARSLRQGRTESVGVVLTEHLSYAFEDVASVDFMAGLAESSLGTDLTLTMIPVGPEMPGRNRSELIARAAVDGYIVYSVADDDPNLVSVRERHLPTVICGQPKNVPDLPFVGIDDYQAIQPAARALIDAGHRKIGILAIRVDTGMSSGFVDRASLEAATLHIQRDRIQGCLDVFAEAGVQDVPIVTRRINDPANARAAAAELLEAHPDLTAVACTTDSMAFGVLTYAREHGLRVPEDLAITGFDGTAPALAAGLTTIIQPNRRKGAVVGKMLAGLLRGEEPQSRHVLLPTTFHAGQTV